MIDVTGYKQAVQALRESEERYRNLYLKTPAVLHSIDAEGKVVSVSDFWLEKFGYTREEVIGRKSIELLTEESKISSLTESIPLMKKQGFAKEVPLNFIKKNGEIMDILLSATVELDENGNYLRSLAVLEDVTERKRAEQTLQHYTERLKMLHELDQAILMAQSPEAIAQATFRHIRHLVPYLQASVTTFDLDTNEAMLLAVYGAGDDTVKTGLYFPLGVNGVTATLEQGKVYIVRDTLTLPQPLPMNQALQAKGLRSYINVPLVAYGDLIGSLNLGSDKPGAFSPEHVDIACEVANGLAIAIQQARLLADLQDAQTQLIQRERLAALGQVAATVAHEMRNPLMAIHMGVEYLLHDVAETDSRWHGATLMQANMDRINRIVEDILFIARGPHPNLKSGLLRPIIEAEVARCEWLLAEKKISCRLHLAADLPPLYLDSDQMARALSNLISNSLDALSPGGELTLSLRMENENQIVTLADNGPGIPPEQLPQIFEPFFTTKSRGTGLGLSIVKQIIDVHRGHIDACSEMGIGTKFTITLPTQ
ncbi:PAS domain S-box protein [Chloroflexi bacterium TSY]|nr:PAS domain S-box protein [Chloroflexi bacterium TSY]